MADDVEALSGVKPLNRSVANTLSLPSPTLYTLVTLNFSFAAVRDVLRFSTYYPIFRRRRQAAS